MIRRPFLALLLAVSFISLGFAQTPKKLLLLSQGPDGHPAESHEYVAGLKVLEKSLAKVPGLEIATVRADEPWRDGPERLRNVDGVVLYLAEGAKWVSADPQRLAALRKLASNGVGFVALHWAIGTKDAKPIDAYLQLLGGCHGGADRKYKFAEFDVLTADPKHPIATGVEKMHVRDEFYYQLKFVKPDSSIQPILRVPIDGEEHTVAWAWERPDGGRSFGFSGLHYHENWRREGYRRLVAQAVLWTLKLPIPKEGLAVPVAEEDLKLK